MRPKKKKMRVSDCMVIKIRVGRSGYFFLYKPTSMLLPLRSHKHAVQCFWFQISVKCTRKWRKLLKSETDRFCRSILFIYIFDVKMLGSVDRKHTYYFFWLDITEKNFHLALNANISLNIIVLFITWKLFHLQNMDGCWI
jgi:hypothetical protein